MAILGSGNIGTDLLMKIQRSAWLTCALFCGRNHHSRGLQKAQLLGVATSDRGIAALVEQADTYQLVFDATSAEDHLQHWPILEKLGKSVIDMTPSQVGRMFVPAVDSLEEIREKNVNMISCGGQTALPLIAAVSGVSGTIDYIEVVSSIASKSAGPATRLNIDEYIETTEKAIKFYSGCRQAKKILILNPAHPSVPMQTTISLKIEAPDIALIQRVVQEKVNQVKAYVPGYELLVSPRVDQGRVFLSVKVLGVGDYLPTYAGNLDIINCAALVTAEEYAKELCLTY